jgi:hypothetical protein
VSEPVPDRDVADTTNLLALASTAAPEATDEQVDEDLATVRSAHDFDSGTAPYQPEVLHVARAAERLADEVDRLRAAMASAQTDTEET